MNTWMITICVLVSKLHVLNPALHENSSKRTAKIGYISYSTVHAENIQPWCLNVESPVPFIKTDWTLNYRHLEWRNRYPERKNQMIMVMICLTHKNLNKMGVIFIFLDRNILYLHSNSSEVSTKESNSHDTTFRVGRGLSPNARQAIQIWWPGDGIWRHRSRPTVDQAMAWCLTASSHYLNHCWLLICEILWHSHDHNLQCVHKLQ